MGQTRANPDDVGILLQFWAKSAELNYFATVLITLSSFGISLNTVYFALHHKLKLENFIVSHIAMEFPNLWTQKFDSLVRHTCTYSINFIVTAGFPEAEERI